MSTAGLRAPRPAYPAVDIGPLRLEIRPASDHEAPPIDSLGTEVWRDRDGTLCAIGYRAGQEHQLFVPRIGTFGFSPSADLISVIPLPSADPDLVDDAYHRIALPLALQDAGAEVLHGSAVRLGDGVVALCGRSGAGKSTLAFGLGRRDHELCADDAVAFTATGERIMVRPLPFRMRLRAASAGWFGAPDQLKGSERSVPWQSSDPASFLALFLLAQDAGTDLHLQRLAPAKAFTAVLEHGYYFRLDDRARNRAMLEAYLTLAHRLPVFSLRYPPGLHRVEEMITRIESEVARL